MSIVHVGQSDTLFRFPDIEAQDQRDEELWRQAFVTEHVIHACREVLPHQLPKDVLVMASRVGQIASLGLSREQLSDDELVHAMRRQSNEFNSRSELLQYDPRIVSGLYRGLRAFEDDSVQTAYTDVFATLTNGWNNLHREPAFINKGNWAASFLVQDVLGVEKAVLKIPKTHFITPELVNPMMNGHASRVNAKRYAALELTRGIPHLEQPVAFSAQDSVTISAFARGKTLSEIQCKNAVLTPTEAQQEELVAAFLACIRLGIYADINEDNVLYDEEDGFTIIDSALPQYDEMRDGYTYDFEVERLIFQFEQTFKKATDVSAFRDLVVSSTQPLIDAISQQSR